MSTLTLLDEELALLVPSLGPRPWLDALSDDDHDAVLVGSARSLLVRGLARGGRDGLEPFGDAAGLLAHLVAPGREVHLQVVLDGVRQPDRTVLRPLRSGEVLVHDTSPDGVHLLSLLTAAEAREQLSAALDPHGVTRGAGAQTGATAVVRVRTADADAGADADADADADAQADPAGCSAVVEEVAVSHGDVLGRGRVADAPPGRAAPSGPEVALTLLDAAALARWVEELLAGAG